MRDKTETLRQEVQTVLKQLEDESDEVVASITDLGSLMRAINGIQKFEGVNYFGSDSPEEERVPEASKVFFGTVEQSLVCWTAIKDRRVVVYYHIHRATHK